MKNNKGFTLIELLVTIAIITLVLGITGYSVIRIINSSKEKSQAISISNVKSAARAYIEEYPVNWTKEENGYYTCISINQLVEKGYLKPNQITNLNITFLTITKNEAQAITDIDVTDENKCMINNVAPLPMCNDLTYKGDSQTLIEKSDEQYEIENEEETNHKINAGNYKLKVKPKEGKVWKDNTNSEKTITCTIKKGNPNLYFKIDENNYTSYNSSNNQIGSTLVKITSDVNGTLNIKTSNKNYATASIQSDSIDNEEENINYITKDNSKTMIVNILATRNANTNTNIPNTYITITLTPDDKNYTTTSITYTIGEINRHSVEKPDSSICRNPMYTGSEQELIKEEELEKEGYIFTNHKGTKEGTYTITAKLRYGYIWKDSEKENETKNVTFDCLITSNKVYIQYNGGGTDVTFNGDTTTYSMDAQKFVTKNGSRDIRIVDYNSLIGSSTGLANYNNTSVISFKKTGYIGVVNSEWCLEPNANENTKCFNQNDATLTGKDLADAKGCDFKTKCEVPLYVNWTKNEEKKVIIQYNGGSSNVTFTGNTSTYSMDSEKFVTKNGSRNLKTVDYNNVIDASAGLANYNNTSVISFTRTGYIAKVGAEWCTGQNGTGKCFSHDDTTLTGKKLADAKGCTFPDGKCEVPLYVNWVSDYVNVTFNCNGGTGGGTKTYTKGIANQKFNVTCKKDGYTLQGWADTSTGAKKYDVAANVTDTWISANKPAKTVYAVWGINVCTIKYSPNGGKFTNTNNADNLIQEVNYGKKTGDMRNANGGFYTATKVGNHIIAGKEWISALNSKTFNQANSYDAIDICPDLKTKSQTVTLKVNWDLNVCTIKFNPNGGKFNKNATDTTYKIKYGNSVSNMRNAKGDDGYYDATRSGYQLTGSIAWISSFEKKKYDQGAGYSAVQLCPNLKTGNQTVTLYANFWRYIYRTCGSGNRCAAAGCASTSYSCSTCVDYNLNAPLCAAKGGSFSQGSSTTGNGTGKCTYSCNCYTTCTSYYSSASACGCAAWNSWTTSSCSVNANTCQRKQEFVKAQ